MLARILYSAPVSGRTAFLFPPHKETAIAFFVIDCTALTPNKALFTDLASTVIRASRGRIFVQSTARVFSKSSSKVRHANLDVYFVRRSEKHICTGDVVQTAVKKNFSVFGGRGRKSKLRKLAFEHRLHTACGGSAQSHVAVKNTHAVILPQSRRKTNFLKRKIYIFFDKYFEKLPPAPIKKAAPRGGLNKLSDIADIFHQAQHHYGIAVFVVVPGNQLYKVGI